jgi:hypothetical protein
MRRTADPKCQIDFLISVIEKDIHHYEEQGKLVNKWIHLSILSLKHIETSLLEELRDEYKIKEVEKCQLLGKFKKTLKEYQKLSRGIDNYVDEKFEVFPSDSQTIE